MTPAEKKQRAMRRKLLTPVTTAQAAIISHRLAAMMIDHYLKTPNAPLLDAMEKAIDQFDREVYGGELKRMQAEMRVGEVRTPFPGGRTRIDTYKRGKRTRRWETP